MFRKFWVINGEYIVKISRGIVELVYEVKPFGFLEVWHKKNYQYARIVPLKTDNFKLVSYEFC